MELIILKQDTLDWNNAWEWLANHPINKDITEPHTALNDGEIWQYMGSYLSKGVLITNFRHRSHPKTSNVYRCSYGHPEFSEDNFKTRSQIK